MPHSLLSSLLLLYTLLVAPKKQHGTYDIASLSTCSHNTRKTAQHVYFHVLRWKVIHLVQWSLVLSSAACLSAICSHLSIFPPAMVFPLPRRIEWIHHPSMSRPQGLLKHAVNYKNHSSPAKIHLFKMGNFNTLHNYSVCIADELQTAPKI